MKKLFTLFLLLFSFAALAGGPISVLDLKSSNVPWTDDTATIQACINAGSCTLTTGTYSVTTLTVSHNLNINGSTINCTNTSGISLNMTTAGVTISGGGTVKGLNDDPNSGQAGIGFNAANVTISGITIRRFGRYGIVGGNFSNQTVSGDSIIDIGYLGVSLIATTNAVSGTHVTSNVIDRSMQPTSVPQAALIVRSILPGTSTVAVITGNTFKMPANPVPYNQAAECFEIRAVTNATISNNTFINGTLGLSIISGSNGLKASTNSFSGQSYTAIELGASTNCKISSTTITSGNIGILVDFTTGNLADTIQTANISGLTIGSAGGKPYPVFVTVNTATPLGLLLNDLTISTTTNALYIAKSNGIVANRWNVTGNNTTAAIFEDTAPGGITMNSCTWSGFTKLFNAYATTSTVISNVQTTGALPTGGFLGFNLLSSYVTLGSNIVFNPVVAIPNISYTPSTSSYSSGATVSLIPVNTGGAAVSYAISPNLTTNTGLSFSTSTGVISGTASIADTSISYTVTATNAAGSGNTVVKIAVSNTPVIAYSPAVYNFTNGSVSTTSAPVSTGGSVISYALAGTLPAGLSFNTSTGVISGTPTVNTLSTSYTVTATNASGTGSAAITIAVKPPVPVITYSTPHADTAGIATTPLSPTNTGGTPTAYSGTLPGGLSLNTTTGIISGTPLAAAALATYTVTATNAGGSGTFGIGISVAPNLVFTRPATRFYGAVDFDPGATSISSIVYTSSNPAIASIVSNQVHITGTGTVNITATSSGISITQPLIIAKKALIIAADAKTKSFNTVNPTLTITYTGFAYGQNSSVFSRPVSIGTTASTGTAVGDYPISVGNALATNYIIIYANSFLHITP